MSSQPNPSPIPPPRPDPVPPRPALPPWGMPADRPAQAPGAAPTPGQGKGKGVKAKGKGKGKKPDTVEEKPAPWGWLEAFLISQTVLPALVFIPGTSPLRTPIRAAAYVIGLVAWYYVAKKAKFGPGSKSFPARPWLLACGYWLVLSILHPNTYSLLAAIAQVAMYFSVMSPALWAPLAIKSPKQVGRLMMIMLFCNATSSLFGMLQVYKPDTFNPPYIPAMNNIFGGADLSYEGADGKKIMRPCGLTDTPGGVAPAALATALTGLCWAMMPLPIWKRVGSLGIAFLGIAVIYYTQVRFSFVMLSICVLTLTGLLILQRDVKRAALLSTSAISLIVVAFTFVALTAGEAMINRFMTLATNDPGKLYGDSRGSFIEETFDVLIWDYPLGYGMGWWGMINAIFGSPGKPSNVWCEVMIPAWVFDGGLPLFIAYVIAILAAMFDSLRIALTCKDKEVAYWASVIIAYNLSTIATCFSIVTFLSPLGLPFWLLAGALHAADARTRVVKKAPAVGPAPMPRPGPAMA